MKTAVMSIKVDEDTKKRAQAVAGQFGIPLSTLVNAYLIELGTSGQIHFGTAEMMTAKMDQIAEIAKQEIASDQVSQPFSSAKEANEYLQSL